MEGLKEDLTTYVAKSLQFSKGNLISNKALIVFKKLLFCNRDLQLGVKISKSSNEIVKCTEALEGHFDLLLITYYLLLITYYLLLITYYLLLITYYLLLITYYLLLTTYYLCLLLIISFITPITTESSIVHSLS